jgi:hypothetical protein
VNRHADPLLFNPEMNLLYSRGKGKTFADLAAIPAAPLQAFQSPTYGGGRGFIHHKMQP